jgi:preprotein translocase subunit SecD
MLEFPRWKYALVVIVLLVGLLFALPNVFGDQNALQVERKDRVAMDDAARQTVADVLKTHGVNNDGMYFDSGRLMIRFNAVADQLKARDAVNEALSAQYRSALTTAPNTPVWMRSMGLRPMSLGLDLRGGLYLLYQVDVNSTVAQLLSGHEQSFRRTLNEARLAFTDTAIITKPPGTITDTVRITLPPGANALQVRDRLQSVNTDLAFTTIDLPSGPAVDMTLTATQISARQTYAIDQTRTTLNNRVNELGVAESFVQRQGLDRVNVQLPGVSNSSSFVSRTTRETLSRPSSVVAHHWGRVSTRPRMARRCCCAVS